MDVEELQKKGLEPLKPALERIAALNDSKGIATLIGDLAAAGNPVALFRLDVEPDPKDSKKPILSLSPGGVTLLDRETYGGATSENILNRYEAHIVRVLLLTGERTRAALTQAMSEAVAVRVSRERWRRLLGSARSQPIRTSATTSSLWRISKNSRPISTSVPTSVV